jgi:hypothetical protein
MPGGFRAIRTGSGPAAIHDDAHYHQPGGLARLQPASCIAPAVGHPLSPRKPVHGNGTGGPAWCSLCLVSWCQARGARSTGGAVWPGNCRCLEGAPFVHGGGAGSRRTAAGCVRFVVVRFHASSHLDTESPCGVTHIIRRTWRIRNPSDQRLPSRFNKVFPHGRLLKHFNQAQCWSIGVRE